MVVVWCAEGVIHLALHLFPKKKHNSQPETARLARRAVTLAKLAALYNVDLSGEGAAQLAARVAHIPDGELIACGANSPVMLGCPRGMAALFAGFSKECARCPYNIRAPAERSDSHCALNQSESRPQSKVRKPK